MFCVYKSSLVIGYATILNIVNEIQRKRPRPFLCRFYLAHSIKTYSEAIVQFMWFLLYTVPTVQGRKRFLYSILFKVQGTVHFGIVPDIFYAK